MIKICHIFYGYTTYTNIKKKIQERALSSSSIFELLKISCLNISKNKRNNFYVGSLIKATNELDNQLKLILENKNLNLNSKQIKLEEHSMLSQSFERRLTYNIPKELLQPITGIDTYLFDTKNLDSSEVSAYLPSELAKNLGRHPHVVGSIQTENSVSTLKIFKDFLEVFQKTNNSFGLFLIYNLVHFLRSDFDNSVLKKFAESQRHKKVLFKDSFCLNLDNGVDDIVVEAYRTGITEKFGKNLVDCFITNKNVYMASVIMEEKENIPNFADLTQEDRTAALLKLLEVKSPKIYKLFKRLNDRYSDNRVFSETEIFSLGIQCVSILEAANILADSGSQFFQGKSFSKFSISKKYVNSIFSLPLKPKHLPMLVKPNPWQKSKKGGCENLNYGGYLLNKT